LSPVTYLVNVDNNTERKSHKNQIIDRVINESSDAESLNDGVYESMDDNKQI